MSELGKNKRKKEFINMLIKSQKISELSQKKAQFGVLDYRKIWSDNVRVVKVF